MGTWVGTCVGSLGTYVGCGMWGVLFQLKLAYLLVHCYNYLELKLLNLMYLTQAPIEVMFLKIISVKLSRFISVEVGCS